MKKIIKTIAVLALVLSLATVVCTAETSPARPVRVAALKGPTGMAVAHMMKQNESAYEFLIEKYRETAHGGLAQIYYGN